MAGTAAGLAVVPASGVTQSVLTKGQARKAMLTLKQIAATYRVGYPSAANALVCHTAPYANGTVNYCYYEYLHSDGALAAGKAFPNHVDVLAFDSVASARFYIKEMKASRPATAVLSQTASSVVFYQTDGLIATSSDGTIDPESKGPTVSVFSRRGTNVAYTACANPKATNSTALASCATALAKAQLAKIG